MLPRGSTESGIFVLQQLFWRTISVRYKLKLAWPQYPLHHFFKMAESDDLSGEKSLESLVRDLASSQADDLNDEGEHLSIVTDRVSQNADDRQALADLKGKHPRFLLI